MGYTFRMRSSISIIAVALALAACSENTPSRSPSPPPKGGSLAVPTGGQASDGQERVDGGIASAPIAGTPLDLGRPVLVDFSRDDCLPCDLMRPWVDDLRKRHRGTVEVIEVNIDRPENRSLAVFFKARAVPLQVYLDAEGREVARNTGLATLAQMEGELARFGFTKK
jgi:thioredoxin 1